MTHSHDCQAAIDRRTAEIAAWVATWPDHCKTCRGAGASYSTYDPSPAGVALSPGYMVDVEPCPDCAEKGLCSRCGEDAWNPDEDKGQPWCCRHCGWTEKDQCPIEAECFCWMDEQSY